MIIIHIIYINQYISIYVYDDKNGSKPKTKKLIIYLQA